jgi:alpha-1,2-glucosyltransferase
MRTFGKFCFLDKIVQKHFLFQLTTTNLLRLLRFLRTHSIVCIILLILINISIKYYTYEHLFLISDNRHYTFYIWSRLFKRYTLFRYLLTPIYCTCLILLYFQIYDRSLLNILLLSICIILLTIFQKLLEFRYFILPFIILRLSINDKKSSKLFIELFQAIIINLITLYVFCHRTFFWSTHPTILQRFMY